MRRSRTESLPLPTSAVSATSETAPFSHGSRLVTRSDSTPTTAHSTSSHASCNGAHRSPPLALTLQTAVYTRQTAPVSHNESFGFPLLVVLHLRASVTFSSSSSTVTDVHAECSTATPRRSRRWENRNPRSRFPTGSRRASDVSGFVSHYFAMTDPAPSVHPTNSSTPFCHRWKVPLHIEPVCVQRRVAADRGVRSLGNTSPRPSRART
jgi:hypothetical protein